MPLHFEDLRCASSYASESEAALALDALMPEDVAPSVKRAHSLPRPARGMVGPLTLQERQAKLAKYKHKRGHRSFAKRISYECRKKVADQRLRIKGRFVTKQQAVALLGADHELLKRHFSPSN